MKLKPEINEYRKDLSEDMAYLQAKRCAGTATEFELEQLNELTGEYRALLNNPDNYEM